MPAAAAKKPTKQEKAKAKPRAKDKSTAKATEPAKAAGDRDTQHLQERLKQLGYGVKVDGQRGQRTTNALKLFQRDHGLKPDGEIGPRTKAAMRGSSKEAIDEIRKGSKAKSDASNATAGEPSAATSTATGTPRKRVEVRSGEHRVVVYEGDERPPRWVHPVEETWSPQARAAARLAREREHATGAPSVVDRPSPYSSAVGHEIAPGDSVHVPNRIGEESGVFGVADRRMMRRGEGHVQVRLPDGASKTVRAGDLEHMSSAEEAEHLRHAGLSEAKVDPADCSMDHAKLGKKGLPQCPKCSSKLGEKTEEQALLESLVSGPAWLLVEGVESQTRLRQLTLSALDAEQAWMDSLVESQLLESVFLAGLDESAKTAALSSTPSPFSTSKTSNWVARAGGLPDYIQNIAKALVRGGKSVSTAIATSIAAVKRWAAGRGGVHPEVRAAAAKAVAEWEKKRAQTHAASAAKAA